MIYLLRTDFRFKCWKSLPKIAANNRCSTLRFVSTKQPFRILFCGSDEFSVASLKAVYNARDLWQSIEVYTPRSREIGRTIRGNKKSSYIPALQRFATENELPVTQVPAEGIKHFSLPEIFRSPESNNLLITASFGHILPDQFLVNFEPENRLNVHPSLLPKYRGAAPVQWAIANGDTETGVTVQRLVERQMGIDGGEICGVRSGIPIGHGVHFPDLLPELAEVGGDLLVEVLRKMMRGECHVENQDSSQATRAPKIIHDTAQINWESQSAAQIDRKHRAISHQYPMWTTIEGISIQLIDISILQGPIEPRDPGVAILDRKSKPPRLIIHCAESSVVVVAKVKSEGKKEVNVGDWWNGLSKSLRERKEVKFE